MSNAQTTTKVATDADFTRVFVTRAELGAALAPGSSAADVAAVGLSLLAIAPSVAQPTYDANMRRLEARLTGLDGVKDLHGHFGEADGGNRGLWLDAAVVGAMSSDAAFSSAMEVVRAASAPREARNAERLAKLRSSRVAKAVSEVAAAETAPAPVTEVPVAEAPVTEGKAVGYVLVTLGELRDALEDRGPLAAVVGAVSQPAMTMVEGKLSPVGGRLSGVAGVENLVACFGDKQDAVRRLWLDDAETKAVTDGDAAAAAAVEALKTLSEARVAAIGAERAARKAAKELVAD